MKLESITFGGSPPTKTNKPKNWFGRVAFAKILVIILCLSLYAPCGCVENASDGGKYRNHLTNLHDVDGENVASCQIGDVAGRICEVQTQYGDGVQIQGIIRNENMATSISEGKSVHQSPNTNDPAAPKESCSSGWIKPCEIEQDGEDAQRFAHANVQNAVRSEGQVKCSGGKHHGTDGFRTLNEHSRAFKMGCDDHRGLLSSITLAKLPRALYVAYRAPFMILKHHFRICAQLEESLVWGFNHYVQAPLIGLYKSFRCTLYPCGINIVHTALARLTVQLKAQALLKDEYMTMNANLEAFMRDEHNIHQQAFISKDAKPFSIKNIAALLHRTTGIKHCIYWWHAISRKPQRHIQGNYTLPKLLMAIYGNQIRLLIKDCEVYVLWLTFSTGYLFLGNVNYSADIHDVEAAVKNIFGSFAPSPFAVKRCWAAVSDAITHVIAFVDHKMEGGYGYMASVYPDFELLHPRSQMERIGVTLALAFIVYTVIWFIFAAVRGILGIIRFVVSSIITLGFVYVAYDKLKIWYDNSFLRWSFDLLQTQKNDSKSQSVTKTRMKTKSIYAASSQTDHPSVSRRKGADGSKKSVTLWHSVSRRNRLADTVIVNESNKDR